MTLLLTVVMLFTLLSVGNTSVKAEGTAEKSAKQGAQDFKADQTKYAAKDAAKATLTEVNGKDGWILRLNRFSRCP